MTETVTETLTEPSPLAPTTAIATTRHWVLLRGLSRDSRHWEAFPEQLKAAFPQDRVSCLNLPGTGSQHQHRCPANISAMVDWLRQHYRERLTPTPVYLLSISMGSMVAADWMHRFPEEIAAGVMINSSSRLNPVHERLRLLSLLQLLGSLGCTRGQREKIIVNRTSNHYAHSPDLIKRWRIYQQQQPVSLTTLSKQLWAASRFQPPPISQPLLLLASRQDRLVNPQCSEQLARFWSADLRFHKSAGHDIPLDDSRWVLDQLQNWLNSLECDRVS